MQKSSEKYFSTEGNSQKKKLPSVVFLNNIFKYKKYMISYFINSLCLDIFTATNTHYFFPLPL